MPGFTSFAENMPTSWGGCCLFWLLFLSLQRPNGGRPDRWSGWSLATGNVGDYRSDAGNLPMWGYGLCRLSEYHVHSAFRRIGGIRFPFIGATIGFLWYNSYPACSVYGGIPEVWHWEGIIAGFATHHS